MKQISVKVVLNKVQELNKESLPKELDITVKGQSPSIYSTDGYPCRRVQGLIVDIIGTETQIKSFLSGYNYNGVYFYNR